MHYITILKSNGEIVDYRIDNSSPELWTTETLKLSVCSDRKINKDDLETFSFDVLPGVVSGVSIDALTPHIHAYDKLTGLLKNNSGYVAPVFEKKFSIDFLISKLTLAEKSKFINRLTPSVITAITEMQSPRNEEDTTEILQFLVDSGDISKASMQKVLLA